MTRVASELRARGYRIAVDDLGAGYSGLNNLATLRPEFVKIDMSLIRDIHKDQRKLNLVQSLVDFANKANMLIVAEGVETEEEAAAATSAGCHMLQGYLLGRPAALP